MQVVEVSRACLGTDQSVALVAPQYFIRVGRFHADQVAMAIVAVGQQRLLVVLAAHFLQAARFVIAQLVSPLVIEHVAIIVVGEIH
ncbi:hypothetical protein D3C78_1406070 [compost metagenome]